MRSIGLFRRVARRSCKSLGSRSIINATAAVDKHNSDAAVPNTVEIPKDRQTGAGIVDKNLGSGPERLYKQPASVERDRSDRHRSTRRPATLTLHKLP